MQFVAVFKDKNFKATSRQITAENHILFYHQNSAGIWWSMPISDLAASVVAGIMLYRQFKIFKTHGNKLKVEN